MTAKQARWGKRFLVMTIMLLFLIALCMLGGITASIPARAAQQFGQPDVNLPTFKLYQQAVILVIEGNELLLPGNLGGEEEYFPIAPGDSLDVIVAGLEEINLVRHRRAFRAYLIYSGIDRRIQPGGYTFPTHFSELEIAQALASPPTQTTFSILAGWRAEEISEKLAGAGLDIDPDTVSYTHLRAHET